MNLLLLDNGNGSVLCSILFIKTTLTWYIIYLVNLKMEALSVLWSFVALKYGPTVIALWFIRICRLIVVKLLMGIEDKFFWVCGHFSRIHWNSISFLHTVNIGFLRNRSTISYAHSRGFAKTASTWYFLWRASIIWWRKLRNWIAWAVWLITRVSYTIFSFNKREIDAAKVVSVESDKRKIEFLLDCKAFEFAQNIMSQPTQVHGRWLRVSIGWNRSYRFVVLILTISMRITKLVDLYLWTTLNLGHLSLIQINRNSSEVELFINSEAIVNCNLFCNFGHLRNYLLSSLDVLPPPSLNA